MPDRPTSRTSQKLRQTNEAIIIAEIRSLNQRVAELLEQFGLLTMEISNVADDLERHQEGADVFQKDLDNVKEQFVAANDSLKATQERIAAIESKLFELEQNYVDLEVITTGELIENEHEERQ